MKDYATLVFPAGRAQIDGALAGFKISRHQRLTKGETSNLLVAIEAIPVFADQNRERLVELDVNPMILNAEGRVTAVNALLRLAPN